MQDLSKNIPFWDVLTDSELIAKVLQSPVLASFFIFPAFIHHHCPPYLSTLTDLGFIEKRTPITEKNPEKSRKGLCHEVCCFFL